MTNIKQEALNLARRSALLNAMGLDPQWILRARLKEVSEANEAISDVNAVNEALAAPKTPEKQLRQKAPEKQGAVPLAPAQPKSSVIKPAPAPTRLSAEDEQKRMASIASLDFKSLPDHIAACTACPLCQKRTQTVLGSGDPQADWLFIGEAPVSEEEGDGEGAPFSGQAKALLEAMILSLKLPASQKVYISNAVKCDPPEHRTPEVAEIAACRPYLERQIRLISPKVIVLLGRAATYAILNEEHNLASLRGQVYSYQQDGRTIPVIVTYHPSYLLRNLPDKAKAWVDLCLAKSALSGVTAR